MTSLSKLISSAGRSSYPAAFPHGRRMIASNFIHKDCCCFLLSAAFDCVDHNLLLQRLEHGFGLADVVLWWIHSFLSDRTPQVAYGGQLSTARPLLLYISLKLSPQFGFHAKLGYCSSNVLAYIGAKILYHWGPFSGAKVLKINRLCLFPNAVIGENLCAHAGLTDYSHCCHLVRWQSTYSVLWWRYSVVILYYYKVVQSRTRNKPRVPELILVLGSQPARDRSHKPSSRLPLLSARPVVTYPAAEHHCPLPGTLYCLVTDTYM